MNLNPIKQNEELIIDELIKFMDENGYSKQEQITFLKSQVASVKTGNKIYTNFHKISNTLTPALTIPLATIIASSVYKLDSSITTFTLSTIGLATFFAIKSYYYKKVINKVENIKKAPLGYDEVAKKQDELIKEHNDFYLYKRY